MCISRSSVTVLPLPGAAVSRQKCVSTAADGESRRSRYTGSPVSMVPVQASPWTRPQLSPHPQKPEYAAGVSHSECLRIIFTGHTG